MKLSEAAQFHIVAGIRKSLESHGGLTTDHNRALAIIVKELGEVAEAVLDYTRNDSIKYTPDDVYTITFARRAQLMAELGQVAGLIIQMMDNLEVERAEANHRSPGGPVRK